MAESLDKKYLLVDECKWTTQENGKQLTGELLRKANLLLFIKNYTIVPVLFLKSAPKDDAGNAMLPEDVIELMKKKDITIHDLKMLDFRKQFQEIIEQSYIPFNIDKAATSDVWSNIYKLILPNIPEKLFRYRKIDDKGYTIESLKSGTISLCHAGMFPDKYDSYLYLDQDKIREDLKKALKDALRITLSHITQKSSDIRAEKATQICYYRECGYTDEQIIDKILTDEYMDFCNNIGSAIKKQESRFRNPRNSAKIACFTESVQSKYMWDRYADGYKGFALEYDLRKCIFKYNSLGMDVNLFPVIYTELRPDVTLDEGNIHTYEYFKQVGDKNWLNFLSSMISVNQLYWYRSYLYKDQKEYEHEHEWRMLYYNLEDENNYASIPDVGCLNAIYYGPDIIPKDKDELHLIAVEKGLKEYDVALDAGSRRYDLRITAIK